MLTAKNQMEVTSILEITDDVLSGFPVWAAEAVQESTSMVDSKNNVRMSANCKVHKGANEFLVGQVCHSKAVLICLGGFDFRKAQA